MLSAGVKALGVNWLWQKTKWLPKSQPFLHLILASTFGALCLRNVPQNRAKIYKKCLPKSSYKQALFQLHLRSDFEDNLMFKQNGRFSISLQKTYVVASCLSICSCQPKQTRDMQRIQTLSKQQIHNQRFFF